MSIWKSVTQLISRIQKETLFTIAERILLVIISLDFSGNFLLFLLNYCIPSKLVKTFCTLKLWEHLPARRAWLQAEGGRGLSQSDSDVWVQYQSLGRVPGLQRQGPVSGGHGESERGIILNYKKLCLSVSHVMLCIM